VILDLHLDQSLAPWSRIRTSAPGWDASPFDTVWLLDHFAPLSSEPRHPMLDPHVTLGALATLTERVALGVLVNNVANRSAAILASATTALQEISSGRAVLGIGAGASPSSRFATEHRALDLPLRSTMAERHDALAATIEEIRAIWSGRRSSEVTFPTPDPVPPIVVGVNSVTLARRAAELGCGINVRWNHPDVEAILGSADRSVGPYAASVWIPFDTKATDPDAPVHRPFRDLGATRVVLLTTRQEDLDAL
jgi:alkanesulfonate monooxygenase SsuD/methylene tetrahydromethanopterin reductase-like flavin-dependent oxidoreductase (luciferase family)